MSSGDFSRAMIIVLFGMGIVFAVLIGLAFMTSALKFLSVKEKKSQIIEEKKMDIMEENRSEIINQETMTNDELIAVISAAIAACMGAQSNLVIRSIKRVEDMTPVWGKISRQTQMSNRF